MALIYHEGLLMVQRGSPSDFPILRSQGGGASAPSPIPTIDGSEVTLRRVNGREPGGPWALSDFEKLSWTLSADSKKEGNAERWYLPIFPIFSWVYEIFKVFSRSISEIKKNASADGGPERGAVIQN